MNTCPATNEQCQKAYMAGGCTPGCCLLWWNQAKRESGDRPIGDRYREIADLSTRTKT